MVAALHGLTTRSCCLLAGGGSCLLAGIVLDYRDLLRVGCFLIALPLLAAAAVARGRLRLTAIRWLDPPRIEVGRPARVVLRLDNVSRLPTGLLLLEDGLAPALGTRARFVLDRVEPHGFREVEYAVRADVRGRYQIGPLSVRLADPFGLCELPRGFSRVDDLRVLPSVVALPPVRLGGEWNGGGARSGRSVSGAGGDDAATREYRRGDDLRRVHWRSTAHRGELMVRREEHPRQCRAAVLLDGRSAAHRGAGGGSSFESAVSVAASIGVHLAAGGFALRLLDDAGAELTAGTSGGLAARLLLDRLAEVRVGGGRSLAPGIARLRRGGEGLLVAVLGATSSADAEALARLRPATTTCIAILVDPAGCAGGGQRVAAQDPSGRLLEAAGWRVLAVRPGLPLNAVCLA